MTKKEDKVNEGKKKEEGGEYGTGSGSSFRKRPASRKSINRVRQEARLDDNYSKNNKQVEN